MRTLLLVSVAAVLMSCDDPPPVHSVEECTAAGGQVVAAPGPPAHCPEGKKQIGEFPFGIEGAICCR